MVHAQLHESTLGKLCSPSINKIRLQKVLLKNIKYTPRLSKYSPSSCLSDCLLFGSVFVSPPQTISTLLTRALACPTLGLGISPAVCNSVALKSRVENKYRSFRAVS